jgi:hypothetical protein
MQASSQLQRYERSLKKKQAASAQTPRYNPPKSIQKSELLVLAKFTREFSSALKSQATTQDLSKR